MKRNKTNKCNSGSSWEKVENSVLKSFDLNDVGTTYAISEWQDHVRKTNADEEISEPVHAFSSEEVIKASVDFFRADIEENIAIFRSKVARNDRMLALLKLRNALGTHEGFFIKEDDGDQLVPEKLAVLRVSKAARNEKLKKVIDLSMKIANSENNEELQNVSCPPSLGDDIKAFVSDLIDVVRENESEGKETIIRICENHEFAKQVQNDPELPKPLRFLAGIIVETKTENHLPKKEKSIGFNAAQ